MQQIKKLLRIRVEKCRSRCRGASVDDGTGGSIDDRSPLPPVINREDYFVELKKKTF